MSMQDVSEGLEDEQRESKSRWFLKLVLGIFLLILIVLFVVPYYGVKIDPEPERIISVEEALEGREYAKDLIKFVADKVVASACMSGNKVCHAKALFYFVRDNFRYVADPAGKEYIEKPEEFLLAGGGDCESGSLFLVALLESVGIKAEVVARGGHAFVRAYLPEVLKKYKKDGYVYLDWTCKQCGFGELR